MTNWPERMDPGVRVDAWTIVTRFQTSLYLSFSQDPALRGKGRNFSSMASDISTTDRTGGVLVRSQAALKMAHRLGLAYPWIKNGYLE